MCKRRSWARAWCVHPRELGGRVGEQGVVGWRNFFTEGFLVLRMEDEVVELRYPISQAHCICSGGSVWSHSIHSQLSTRRFNVVSGQIDLRVATCSDLRRPVDRQLIYRLGTLGEENLLQTSAHIIRIHQPTTVGCACCAAK